MLLTQISEKVHLLKCRKTNTTMGLTHNNKSYVLAFVKKADVFQVRQYVNTHTNIHYNLREVVEPNAIAMGNVVIQKKININEMLLDVEQLPLANLLCYPIEKNLGIVFAIHELHDTHKALVYSSLIINPEEPRILRLPSL